MSAGTDASLWLRERRAQRRAEVLQQNQKSQTHQDHLRGAASVKAHFVPEPEPTAEPKEPTFGVDVRRRREARREGAEHTASSASWTGDGHTPRKGGMYGSNAALPRAEAGAGRAGEVAPHSDRQNPRAHSMSEQSEFFERPTCRKIVTGVPRELCTSVDHPLHDNTPTTTVTTGPHAVAGSGPPHQLNASPPSKAHHTTTSVSDAPPGTPGTPTAATNGTAAAPTGEQSAAAAAASSPVGGQRRGGVPRSGRTAGEEGFEPGGSTGRRRPSVHNITAASPVHPTRGGGKGHHPNPGHHRWSATNASPINVRNVLTATGINIEDGCDTPVANLQHHPPQEAGSRKIPQPDPSKNQRDARQLGHHVTVVGSELLNSEATGKVCAEPGHDAKPGRRQQRLGGHGHALAHEMHPDGAGAWRIAADDG